ncbi:MAG: PilZ domain-containing protein [Planctomycetota bacterium]|nr:PilZ domain-containing protein [Planctomycetota bacterium]
MSDQTDRRRHPRNELERPCRIADPRTGKFLHGTTCNYSRSGVLIRIHRSCAFTLGETLSIGIAFDERQGFMQARDMMEAKIIRALGTPNGETMVALEYTQAQIPLQDSDLESLSKAA